LASYESTLKALVEAKKTSVIEHRERHTDDSGGEEKDDDEKGDEEAEAEGNETDRGDEPEGDEKDGDGDEEDGEDEEEEASNCAEEEEASSTAALRAALVHVKDPKERAKLQGQLAALVSKSELYDKDIAALKRDMKAREKSTLLQSARAAGRITPGE